MGGISDDWLYGNGISWSGEIFTASMDSTLKGLEADTIFSLSARKEWGVWTLETSYIGDWEERELNNTWRNHLSLGARAVYGGWTVSPSAELSWQAEDGIDNDARFRLDLRHDL